MPQLAQGKKTGAVEGVNTVNEELHEKYDAKYGKDMNHYVPVTTLFRVFGLMVAPGFAFAPGALYDEPGGSDLAGQSLDQLVQQGADVPVHRGTFHGLGGPAQVVSGRLPALLR